MTIPVAIVDLVAKTEEYGWAYLLTVRDDQRPHIVAVAPVWDGELLTMDVGRRTADNVEARPLISLCYPPTEEGAYSLIVDGQARIVADHELHFMPTDAVLHRPAPVEFDGSSTECGSDCVPVSPTGS
jgi:hypothetical protein